MKKWQFRLEFVLSKKKRSKIKDVFQSHKKRRNKKDEDEREFLEEIFKNPNKIMKTC